MEINSELTWSDEQNAIFAYGAEGPAGGNAVVIARAGTGKTTAAKEFLRRAPERRQALYAVFNKKNQLEAEAKFAGTGVEVRTCNSLGARYCTRALGRVQYDTSVEFDRVEKLFPRAPRGVIGNVVRIIGFAKNTIPAVPTTGQLLEIIETRGFSVESEQDQADGWTDARCADLARDVLQATFDQPAFQGKISFDDQVWLPVVKNWAQAWWNLVVIDEAQDTSPTALELVARAVRHGGRFVAIGDDRQAIYGFRGADTQALERIRVRFNCRVFPLTTTYRCPKAVVALAARLVPDYRAADAAPAGEILAGGPGTVVNTAEPGDAVVSRYNAPLMPLCLGLLRRGVSARIEGRDVGAKLVALIKKLRATSVVDLIERVGKWAAAQAERAAASKNAESLLQEIEDTAACLVALTEDAATVAAVETRIRELFQDTDGNSRPAVVLSSTHRAKGLEWDKVYVLLDTYKKCDWTPAATEENNLCYVAHTRAKKTLVRVVGRV